MNGIDEQFFGEIAELHLQMESFRQYRDSHMRETIKWVTKSMVPIRVCDLDDNHLDNIINMLKSKSEKTDEVEKWLNFLRREKGYRRDYNNIKKKLFEYQEIMEKVF